MTWFMPYFLVMVCILLCGLECSLVMYCNLFCMIYEGFFVNLDFNLGKDKGTPVLREGIHCVEKDDSNDVSGQKSEFVRSNSVKLE